MAGWRSEEFFAVILFILGDTTLSLTSTLNPLNLQTSDPACITMEKQTLLAIALSAAVLIGWQFLFPPPPPTSITTPSATEVSPTAALEENELAVSENSVSPLSARLQNVDESQPAK